MVTKNVALGYTKRGGQPSERMLRPSNPAEEFFGPEEWAAIAAQLNFSIRELSVAILIFEDRTQTSIARQLRISTSTVRKYADRIYKKLRVKDRAGLILRLLRIHRAISAGS